MREEPPTPSTSARNAAGENRPGFLRHFPHHPQLEPLIERFEQGNFYELRKEFALLDKSQLPDDVVKAAEELCARTEPDPAARALLGLCFVLFGGVVGWVYWRALL